VSKPFVFVSCGQFTEAEKRLGSQIVSLVRTLTGLDAFFAEEVQDLNGLDSNLLVALRDCAGFITVMHPRGRIFRPDGSEHVRASVWIEQEIAIATYIQRVERRELPVIAFIHESVGREGIRDLLHLNPIPFADESNVLAALPARLENWRSFRATGIRVRLKSVNANYQEGHPIRRLEVTLVNDSNHSIDRLNGMICLPAAILAHWTATYPTEVKSNDPHKRCFRFDERQAGHSISPHETRRLIFFDYCTKCALVPAGGIAALVAESTVDAKLWIDGREYTDQRTVKGLAEDREDTGEN
jgi:hypothetical protein